MEVKKFIESNQTLDFIELSNKLKKEYEIEIKIDKTKNYYMISSINNKCDNTKFIKQCSGIVLDNFGNILHYFGEKADNGISNINNININNCYITPYQNGTIIKIFNYKNKWEFATTKHTNIKNFKIKDKNSSLYNIIEECIIKTFYSIDDFLYSLEKDYCYSFLYNNDNIKLINKVFLKTLKEEYNFESFIPINKISEIDSSHNLIFIEKDNNNNIIKRANINKEDMKKIFSKLEL